MGRIALLVAAAPMIAVAAVAGAQEPIALPLEAPAGAQTLLADFIEVCSQALVDRSGARVEAERRGWVDATGESALEAAAKAAGNFSLTMVSGDADTRFLTAYQSVFAHAVVTSCSMQMIDPSGRPEGFDPRIVSRIEGVRPGEDPMAAVDSAAGLWSFIDQAGETVTISSVPFDGASLTLSMSREERVTSPLRPQTP